MSSKTIAFAFGSLVIVGILLVAALQDLRTPTSTATSGTLHVPTAQLTGSVPPSPVSTVITSTELLSAIAKQLHWPTPDLTSEALLQLSEKGQSLKHQAPGVVIAQDSTTDVSGVWSYTLERLHFPNREMFLYRGNRYDTDTIWRLTVYGKLPLSGERSEVVTWNNEELESYQIGDSVQAFIYERRLVQDGSGIGLISTFGGIPPTLPTNAANIPPLFTLHLAKAP